MRPGEKLHELLSSVDESQNMVEFKKMTTFLKANINTGGREF